ncbi:MAG: hypothetical protein WBN53_06285 [Thermodesulfobacteriota bacterium]
MNRTAVAYLRNEQFKGFFVPPPYKAKSSLFIKVGRVNTDGGISIPEGAEKHLGLPVPGPVPNKEEV